MATVDDYVAVGDEIIGITGNQYEVVEIDYIKRVIIAVGIDGERYNFHICSDNSGKYHKV